MFVETKHILDIYKYRWVYLALSALFIIPGIIAMIYSCIIYPTHAPFNLGIDFTGGTISQYSIVKANEDTTIPKLREDLEKNGFEHATIQVINTQSLAEKHTADKSKQEKSDEGAITDIISIKTKFLNEEGSNKLDAVVKAVEPDAELIQISSVGPTLGKELFNNSMVALCLAFAGIVLYLAMRFHLDYSLIALASLAHDALFVCGTFSILGLVFGTQIDTLFITAVLTVVGFSVHDTIVVYDRIRENTKYLSKKMSFVEIVNSSVNQTLARSINTSLTCVITLLALYLFGGVTTRDFVLVMLLGIIIGTYSSIFFASVLLAMHREHLKKTGKKAAN